MPQHNKNIQNNLGYDSRLVGDGVVNELDMDLIGAHEGQGKRAVVCRKRPAGNVSMVSGASKRASKMQSGATYSFLEVYLRLA